MFQRFHRLRRHPTLRSMLAETTLSPSDFVWPLFIREDAARPVPIPSMPGVVQHTIASAIQEVEGLVKRGLSSVLLFGVPARKDPQAMGAWHPNGVIQTAIRSFKTHFPDLMVWADCCLCEYTTHGQCGIVTTQGLDNDATLEVLKKIAYSYAHAGVDAIAPSGMMDGATHAIRQALDHAHFFNTLLIPYAAKYASTLYGPFRDAAGSATGLTGGRFHHQLNPTQRMEAFREVEADVQEGADLLIMKPAMLYLDIIREVRQRVTLPLVAYQVSGEYSMLKWAAQQGMASESALFMEAFQSIKRSGADLIISYATADILRNFPK